MWRRPVPRVGSARALLDRVNNLVSQDVQAAGTARRVFPRPENKVRAVGESARVMLLRQSFGHRSGV